MKEWKGISRRDFLKGAAAGAVGVAAVGVLGGCSPSESNSDEAKSYNVSETKSADIVVVGSGASGICATVQAAELGAQVILLESNSVLGGNGILTEGMLAIGSSLQKASGVGTDITFREVIATEQEFFNYRVNALFWKDLVENSADNLEWLIKNGVKFSGVVDNYYGLGKIEVFHWFVDGSGKNFIEPMVAKAEELGVTILTKTPAADLILDNGKVVGIYAKKDDDSYLQINCKAVILATGGYANNTEMMEARGYDMTYAINQGNPGHNGDGLRMATDAGGADVSLQRCFLREPYSYGIHFFGTMTQAIHRGGPFLWVNENAERYTNEDCGAFTPGNNSNAVHTQNKSFLIFDQSLLDKLAQNVENLVEEVERQLFDLKQVYETSASSPAILYELYEVIKDRQAKLPEGSYTTYLFQKGLDKILKKVGEENAEVIIAAKNRDKSEVIYETSDLLYHLMVLLVEQGVSLDEIFSELKSRR